MLTPETRLKERYRILERIGGGGFGHVYKAIDEVFGCCVAVKETREEVAWVEKMQKAFEREAKLLRNLKHDCLPRVTDYFFETGAQFLVMDFIEGDDLAALLKRRLKLQRPFTVNEVLPWADKILSALEYLHGQAEPIIHRDIKPANIKLADDGGVYLLDFGLAKGSTGQMSTVIEGQSASSVFAGTPGYAPIEQLQCTGTEPQSDVYSLGATLYHLLTGRLPISPFQRDEALQRRQDDPLKPAHQVDQNIPVQISKVISRSLAVRSWDRIASARDMHLALEAARREIEAISKASTKSLPEVAKHTPSKASSPRRHFAGAWVSASRHRRWWLIAGIALALCGAFAAVLRFHPSSWFPKTISEDLKRPLEEARLPISISTVGLIPKKELDERAGGHTGTVWSVVFSRDGRLAASASDDGTIILWNTSTWTPLRKLVGHTGPVYSVAFSADGKILASGSRDKTIRLWNTDTGDHSTLPDDTKQPVLRLAFSLNGNFLASCSGRSPEDGGDEIRIWEAHNRWKPRVLQGRASKIFAIAFSADSQTLASAGLDKRLRLWDLRRATMIDDRRVDASLTTLTFSADGRYLACGDSSGKIRLWSTQGSSPDWRQQVLLAPSDNDKPVNGVDNPYLVTAMAFSPDARTLVTADQNNMMRLWDISSRVSKSLSQNGVIRVPQWSLAFSPDGTTLLSGGQDKTLRVWQ